MKYPTIAKVTYYDDFDEKVKTKQVFLYSEGAKDATDQICEWFGEDGIESFFIKMFEDGLIEVDDTFVEKLERGPEYAQ